MCICYSMNDNEVKPSNRPLVTLVNKRIYPDPLKSKSNMGESGESEDQLGPINNSINNDARPVKAHSNASAVKTEGAQCWRGDIRLEKNSLIDQHGRTILLRGVNLTGNSKLPHSPAKACIPGTDEFYNHRNVSFVGRPFTAEDAHEHFERLYNWGLTFARILVPWEALGMFFILRDCWINR